MTALKIVVCGNAETLDCSEDEAIRFVDEATILADDHDEIEVDCDSNFSTWNGGSGTGRAFVRLVSYGAVNSFDECRKALGFLLSGGGTAPGTQVTPPDAWPSSDLVQEAFDLLEEILDLPIATTDEQR